MTVTCANNNVSKVGHSLSWPSHFDKICLQKNHDVVSQTHLVLGWCIDLYCTSHSHINRSGCVRSVPLLPYLSRRVGGASTMAVTTGSLRVCVRRRLHSVNHGSSCLKAATPASRLWSVLDSRYEISSPGMHWPSVLEHFSSW